MRILVADDVADAAEALAMLLKLEGHTVAVALGGREAISMAAAFRPHVAVLDIGMPEIDGYEVARQIRSSNWGPHVRLVAFTGRSDATSRRIAADCGFEHYLLKPINPEQFLNWMGELAASLDARPRAGTSLPQQGLLASAS